MKRSQIVCLALIGVSASALIGAEFWLNSGEEDVAADVFTSPELCKASGNYTASQCDRAYADATKLDDQNAVSYKTRGDCEADFTPGGCREVTTTTVSSGAPSMSSVFVPAMAGFLIGRALTSGASAQPVYQSCTQAPDQDACRRSWSGGGHGAGGGYFTRSGYRVQTGSVGSGATVSSGAFSSASSAPHAATLSRGGFGARAAAASARA
jgi:uncharacterized protein YgiB involved in biofilm formation